MMSEDKKAYLLLALATLFWGGNIVVGRGMVGEIGPFTLAFLRWTLAFVIAAPLCLAATRRDLPRMRGHWPALIFLAFLSITCFNTLLYIGVQTTTAINGALVQSSMPAFIVLVSLLAFRDRPNPLQAAFLLTSLAGTALVVTRGDLARLLELRFVVGDLFILLAVVLYATYTAFLRRRPPIHPLSFLWICFGFGSVSLLPVFLWEVAQPGGLPTASLDVAMTVLYVAIFPSIGSYLCWNHGVAVIGANRAGLFINLIPVYASVLSILFLGEQLAWYHLAGLALIFTGLVGFNRLRSPGEAL